MMRCQIKYFILFFLFVNTITKVNANIYGGGAGYTIINTLDNGYAVVGIDINVPCFKVVKVDSLGGLEWIYINNSFAIPPDLYHSTCLVQTLDSGFVFALDVAGDASLFKIDKSGVFLWQQTYAPDVCAQIASVIEDPGGNLVLNISVNGDGPENPPGVMITDNSGNILSYSSIGYCGAACGMIGSGGGNYIAVADTFVPAGGPEGVTHIVCSDNTGNFLWHSQIIDPVLLHHGNSICRADSGYFVAGYYYDNVFNRYGYISKIDTSGNILWTNHGNNPNFLNYIVQYLDGFAGLDTSGRLHRCNTLGDTIWTKQILSGAEHFTTTSSGGFVFTGDSIGQVWISLTDSAGNFLRMTNTGISSLPPKHHLELFPNPATTEVTFKMPETPDKHTHISLFDLSGRIIRVFSLDVVKHSNSTITIPLMDLRLGAGQYRIQVLSGRNIYEGAVVVK